MTTGPTAKPRTRARFWAGAALGGFIGLLASGIIVSALARGAPDWWRRPAPGGLERAAAVEDGFVSQLAAMREPSESGQSAEWSFSLRAADATAWANERLPKWLEHHESGFRWPDSLREVQVDFDKGRIRLGVRVKERDTPRAVRAEEDRYYSITLRPRLDPSGELWIVAEEAAMGALPVPPGAARPLVFAWLRRAAAELFDAGGGATIEEIASAVAGARPLVREAVIRVDASRRVRLLKLIPQNDRIDVWARTEYVNREPR